VTGSLFVVSVAVVVIGAAVVADVPAVAAVPAVAVAVVPICVLAVVEIMLVFQDISVLSAGSMPAQETSRSDARMMMIDKNFFILTSEKSIVLAS